MRNSWLQLLFSVLILIFGGAMEELLPKFLGVGFPILLIASQFQALRGKPIELIVFAIAAGAMEDALSSLPLGISSGFFVLTAAMMHWARLPRTATLLTFPLYQVWLAMWMPELSGSVFGRVLLAVPMGLVTAFAVVMLLAFVAREVALDEQG